MNNNIDWNKNKQVFQLVDHTHLTTYHMLLEEMFKPAFEWISLITVKSP